MKKHLGCLALLPLLFLISCQQPPFTPEERANLKTVSIPPAQGWAKAKKPPKGYDQSTLGEESKDEDNSVLQNLFAETAGAIAAGVQNSIRETHFQREVGHLLPTIEKHTPSNFNPVARTRFEKSLKKDLFFKNRVRSKSAAQLQVTAESVRFLKSHTSGGLMNYQAEAILSIALLDSQKRVMMAQSFTGLSTLNLPLKRYAGSKKLAHQAFREAIDSAALQFEKILTQKTRPLEK